MSQWLARVEELFEARAPKNPAIISDLDWDVTITPTEKYNLVTITCNTLNEEEYFYAENYTVLVKEWQEVKEKQVIAKSNVDKQKVVATNPWIVKKENYFNKRTPSKQRYYSLYFFKWKFFE